MLNGNELIGKITTFKSLFLVTYMMPKLTIKTSEKVHEFCYTLNVANFEAHFIYEEYTYIHSTTIKNPFFENTTNINIMYIT